MKIPMPRKTSLWIWKKVDFKALQQISGTMVSGDTSKGISMKQTQTLLEAAGFKEAK